MYIFCDINLYTRRHDIWNQISYEIKENACINRVVKLSDEYWNMTKLTSAYNVSGNNIGKAIWLYTSKTYVKHRNGKRHTNMDINMV